MLDPLDEEHLFSLHYVFLPKINQSLNAFRLSWNNHGLRTERGMNPQQLFTAGVLQMRHSGLVAVDFFNQVSDEYGSESDEESFGLIDINDIEGVFIPESSLSPTELQLAELQEHVNPLTYTEDYGVSLYIETLQIVQSWSRSL